MAHHLNYTAGVLVASGGLVGYLKTKSMPSLVAGVGIGALYGVSGYLISHGHPDRGHQLATVTSATLTLAMAPRYMRSKKMMPAGGLTILGSALLLYNGKKAYEWEYGT